LVALTPYFYPFYCHFSLVQIAYEANDKTQAAGEPVLVEIGPRFVLNPVKIFGGSFRGAVLWENPEYISPNLTRSMLKRKTSSKYVDRVEAKKARHEFVEQNPLKEDEFADVFA